MTGIRHETINEETEYVDVDEIDDDHDNGGDDGGTFDAQTNLSPLSNRSRDRLNNSFTDDGNSSLLGVIVDRSSFDDDEELTTYNLREVPSVIDENNVSSSSSVSTLNVTNRCTQHQPQMRHNSLIDMSVPGGIGGGGVVMRNGKVRRKLRWKPKFVSKSNKKGIGGDDNASVVSALTKCSVSTSRSSSTTRSFLSHFSKRSNTSFHTFHSTETPIATNKANRPQAPHTVMRPNYSDSFDKQSTIEMEGRQNNQRNRGTFRSSLDSVQEQEAGGGMSLRLQNQDDNDTSVVKAVPIPNSPSTTPSILSSPPRADIEVSNISTDNEKKIDNSKSNATGKSIPLTKSQQQRPNQTKSRRPPLFKRRMRHFKNINTNSSINSKGSTKNHNIDSSGSINSNIKSYKSPSPSKTEKTVCSSPSDTNSTSTSSSSISPSLSLERENSVIPVSLGEEYEEDCRVLFSDPNRKSTTTSKSNRNGNKSVLGAKKMPRNIVTVTTATRSSKPNGLSSQKRNSLSAATDDIVTEEGIEEVSVSPSVQSGRSGSLNGNGGQSGVSVQSGSSNKSSLTALQKRLPSMRKKRSTSSTSASTSVGSDSNSNSRNMNKSLISHPPSPSGTASARSLSNNTGNSPVKNKNKLNSGPQKNATEEGVVCEEAEHNLRAINDMAAEHMAHGEYVEAADVFEEILRGQQERYGQDHYRVGTALHNLGIVYLKMGDFTRAIEVCQRAVNVRKDSLVPNHPDVAVSLAQLGVAHLESQNFNKALSAFRDALHIRRNFLGPRHPKCSKILNNIGCALYSLNDFIASKRAFDEALSIQREALRSIPSTESSESTQLHSNAILLSMASTLCNIGSIKVRWCKFDEAMVDLEEALLIQQSVLGDNHPTVSSTYDSISLVDKAKSGSSSKNRTHDFYMDKAVAVCSDSGTNATTVITELFGIENFESIAAVDWLQNACGPATNDSSSF